MKINKKIQLLVTCILIGLTVALISIKINILFLLIGAVLFFLLFLKKEFLVIGIIVSVDNIFYLVKSNIGEKISVFLCFVIIIQLLYYLSNISKKNWNALNFKYPIIAFILLIIMEIINSYYLYNQPLILGVKASKWYLIIFVYFFVSYLLINNYISQKKVENIILSLGFIASLLYIVQYFLFDKILFLNVNFLERFGEVRFYQGISLVVISFFLGLQKIIQYKKTSFTMVLICITNMFYILIVANSRTITIPVLIATLTVFILQRKFNRYLIFVLVYLLVFIYLPLMKIIL
ncbi:hypothetical protein GTW56_13955 [Bacillus sp. EB93]|nr:hypothetical protein [Peribacillus frigoritolerans]